MIVTGLVGALVTSDYKWGYFVFANVALFAIFWNVIVVGRKHAAVLGGDVSRTFILCGGWTMFLWFIYPIAWGVSEGGNVIHPDGEAIFYSVLDVLAKPVFGALLLWGHRNIDPAVLGLNIRDYGDEVHEKRIPVVPVVPVAPGVAHNNGVAHDTTTTTIV
jgi:bacteriorhodopsin